MGRNRQGLRKLSADLIDKATDETASQVVRLMLAFVGTAAFCLLSLASPDIGLLTSNEKLTVPGAGPVSFFGFMLLGPTILIVLRIYLQIYVEHSGRLNRIADRMPVVRAPTLAPLKNPLIRGFSGLTFYLLLPVTTLDFAWKAAVFAPWGSGLLCVAAGVIASHAMLPLRRVSWPARGWLSVGVAILAGGAMLSFGPLRRPFELYRENLSAASLQGYDLDGANLNSANLSNADLVGANLNRANLDGADLHGANLDDVNLNGADLYGANLVNAKLIGADLSKANLGSAHLNNAKLVNAKLIGADLSKANLGSAQLNNADLTGANLTGTELGVANLVGANLVGANLSNAFLLDADLSKATLGSAQLNNAKLGDAKLIGADLSKATLDDAQLNGANLANANLRDADLRGANLDGANLDGANLDGADLRGTKLDGQQQLKGACGASAELPPELILKPCPP
jgi:uncharacterized protein YjbI with pentapeptide repeats